MTDFTTNPLTVPPPAPVSRPRYHLPITFTGSGDEYFRIWIVNLLLMLVTLGFYLPWAKVRRLRYFYGNTLVDGSALDFQADPQLAALQGLRRVWQKCANGNHQHHWRIQRQHRAVNLWHRPRKVQAQAAPTGVTQPKTQGRPNQCRGNERNHHQSNQARNG